MKRILNFLTVSVFITILVGCGGNKDTGYNNYYPDTLPPKIMIQSAGGEWTQAPSELNSVRLIQTKSYIDETLKSLKAEDGEGNILVVSAVGHLDPFVPGKYTVEYTATDKNGETVKTTKVFDIEPDEEPPSFIDDKTKNTLDNLPEIKLPQNSQPVGFPEAIKAIDNSTGGIKITTEGEVDYSTPGIYPVKYIAVDEVGNSSTITRDIIIEDNTPPVITINVDGDLTWEIDGTANVPTKSNLNGTATDREDGSVILHAEWPDINVRVPGIHVIKFWAEDSAGNRAEEIRRVIVQDTTPPKIKIFGPPKGEATFTLIPGKPFASYFTAIATDILDGSVPIKSVQPKITGPGEYIQTYTATDAAGNTSTETFKYIIKEVINEAPVVKLQWIEYGNRGQSVFPEPNGSYSFYSNTQYEIVVSASDKEDGTLPAKKMSNPDLSVPGTYKIEYKATDKQGISSSLFLTINVTEADVYKPKLTTKVFVNGVDVTLPNTTGSFTKYTVKSTDKVIIVPTATDKKTKNGKDMPMSSAEIIGPRSFDPSNGLAIAKYSISDEFGNSAANTILFKVANEAPVITITAPQMEKVKETDDTIVFKIILQKKGDMSFGNDMTFTSIDDKDGKCNQVFAGDRPRGKCIIYSAEGSFEGIDPSVPGKSIGTIISEDTEGAISKKKMVLVFYKVDVKAPVIELLGGNIIKIIKDQPFIEPGYTAIDDFDGDITDRVIVKNPVDTSIPGTYNIVYIVKDNSGKETRIERTVIVIENQPPVLKLIGKTFMKINQNSKFDEPGYTAIDDLKGDISASVKTIGSVDSTKPGFYTLKYTVSDGINAPATAFRKVQVIELDPPSITYTTIGGPNYIIKVADDSYKVHLYAFEMKITAKDSNGEEISRDNIVISGLNNTKTYKEPNTNNLVFSSLSQTSGYKNITITATDKNNMTAKRVIKVAFIDNHDVTIMQLPSQEKCVTKAFSYGAPTTYTEDHYVSPAVRGQAPAFLSEKSIPEFLITNNLTGFKVKTKFNIKNINDGFSSKWNKAKSVVNKDGVPTMARDLMLVYTDEFGVEVSLSDKRVTIEGYVPEYDLYTTIRNAVAAGKSVEDFDVTCLTNYAGLFSISSPSILDPKKAVSGDTTHFINFAQDLSRWNTKNALTMKLLFAGVYNNHTQSHFNQDLSAWDFSGVKDMSYMFFANDSFNQDVSAWDTSSVTTMAGMFMLNTSFNQSVSDWDVTSVRTVDGMFLSSVFNNSLEGWDTSTIQSFNQMFKDDKVFNQKVNHFDMSSINTSGIRGMFEGAIEFNQPVEAWDISGTESLSATFKGASKFNQPLAAWDTSNIRELTSTFQDATAFNQELNNWNTSSLGLILTGSVQNNNFSAFFDVFNGASSFNQDISSWNVSRIQAFERTFSGATTFNQSLTMWDTSSSKSMAGTFFNATLFNQDLSDWDVINVTRHNGFNTGSSLAQENLPAFP